MTDPTNPNLSAPPGSDLGEGVVERLAKEATKKRFKCRLATKDQRNGYEVGWFEGYQAALRSTPSSTLTPDADYAQRIYKVLRDHRLTNMADEDGENGYPLVDAVSNEAPATIATGEEQLQLLAAEIAFAVATPAIRDRAFVTEVDDASPIRALKGTSTGDEK